MAGRGPAPPGWVIELVSASMLTDRQLEVLRLVLDSASVKIVAERLALSPHTVRHHLEAAQERTGSSSREQLVAWADDHIPGWREHRPAA